MPDGITRGLRKIGEKEAKAGRAIGHFIKKEAPKVKGFIKKEAPVVREFISKEAPAVRMGVLGLARYEAMGLEYLEQKKLNEIAAKEAKGIALTESEKKMKEKYESRIRKIHGLEEKIKAKMEALKAGEMVKREQSLEKIDEVLSASEEAAVA
jgi:hypothetical protein